MKLGAPLDGLLPHNKNCANRNCAGARQQGRPSRNNGGVGRNEVGRCCARLSERTRSGPSPTGTASCGRATMRRSTLRDPHHAYLAATTLPPPTSSSRRTMGEYAFSRGKVGLRFFRGQSPKTLEHGAPRPRLPAICHMTKGKVPRTSLMKKTKVGPT